jgi:hypothetical protein
MAWPRPAKLTATAALVVAVLVPPFVGAVQWVQLHGAETTQTQAWRFIKRQVWVNSKVLSEARRLDLPAERYRYEFAERIADRDPDAVVASGVEWIILSSDAWRGQRPAASSRPGPPEPYAPFLQRYQVVKVILPAPGVAGPELHILKLAGR